MKPESLLALRKRHGRNKKAMAEDLGISWNAYVAYEEGRQPIKKVVALACAALGHGLPPME